MRSSHLFAALALAVTWFASADAIAQRNVQTAAQVRTTTAPAQRFRARPANERALAARQLLGDMRITISEEYLNAPFTLSARDPDVNGRGWLDVTQLRNWYTHAPPDLANEPWAGDAGIITLVSSYGEVTLHLANSQGRRFLIDCTVNGAGQVQTRTSSGAMATLSTQNTALISLVTAPGDDAVMLSANGSNWRFLGCEITRLQ